MALPRLWLRSCSTEVRPHPDLNAVSICGAVEAAAYQDSVDTGPVVKPKEADSLAGLHLHSDLQHTWRNSWLFSADKFKQAV